MSNLRWCTTTSSDVYYTDMEFLWDDGLKVAGVGRCLIENAHYGKVCGAQFGENMYHYRHYPSIEEAKAAELAIYLLTKGAKHASLETEES